MTCSRCGYHRYQLSTAPFPYPTGRPRFHCLKCSHTWTSGHDGGGYVEHAEPDPGINKKVLYFRLKEIADEDATKAAVGVCRSDVALACTENDHEGWTFDDALSDLISDGYLTETHPEPKTDYHRSRLMRTFSTVPDVLYRVSFQPWSD